MTQATAEKAEKVVVGRSVLIPSTPLLLDETSGAATAVLSRTRQSVEAAYRWVLAGRDATETSGDLSVSRELAIVARGDDTSQWHSSAVSALPGLGAAYDLGAAQAGTGQQSRDVPGKHYPDEQSEQVMPLGLSVARELLNRYGAQTTHDKPAAVAYHSVGLRPNADELAALTTSLADKDVVFVADGSTKLGDKPPGGTYEGAAAYESKWHNFFKNGKWSQLSNPDWREAERAGHVDVGVIAALAARAIHLHHGGGELLQQESPYGVGYCVAQIA